MSAVLVDVVLLGGTVENVKGDTGGVMQVKVKKEQHLVNLPPASVVGLAEGEVLPCHSMCRILWLPLPKKEHVVLMQNG